MERWEVKIVNMAILFGVVSFSTMIPICVSGAFYKRGRTGQQVIRVLLCFGGGVFLGTYLMHMAPEVRHILTDALMVPKGIDYPLPELFTGLGFFLLMFLEKIIFDCTGAAEEETEDEHVKQGQINTAYDTTGKNDQVIVAPTSDPSSHGHSHTSPSGNASAIKAVVFLMALSIHCIFEGLGLGLQSTSSGVWQMTIAILSHEIVIGFTLGLNMLKSNSKTRVAFLAIAYGLTTPIGGTIGTIITETSTSDDETIALVAGVMQAMSAGVFIYCTFLEILKEEISHTTPYLNLFFVFVGFGLMACTSMIHHELEHEAHEDMATMASMMASTEMMPNATLA